MGFQKVGATLFTKASHKHFYSRLNDVWHAWYVGSKWRPLDSGGINGQLQFPGHWAIWESITCCNSKLTAVSRLKTTNNFCLLYGRLGSILLTLDALLLITFRNNERTACQPRPEHIVLLTMHNFDPYSTQWQMLLPISQLISTCLKPSQLYSSTVIAS